MSEKKEVSKDNSQELKRKLIELNNKKINEVYNEIRKILDKNNLKMVVEHKISIINK
jgi:DNA-binding protein Fis